MELTFRALADAADSAASAFLDNRRSDRLHGGFDALFEQLQATFEQGLDNPIVLDPLKARFFAVQTEAFLDASETALRDGLVQRSKVLLYVTPDGEQVIGTPDGEQVIGERLSQHPGARLAFGPLAKNLGATAAWKW